MSLSVGFECGAPMSLSVGFVCASHGGPSVTVALMGMGLSIHCCCHSCLPACLPALVLVSVGSSAY